VVTLESLRTEKREQIIRLARSHGVRYIGIFGSVARLYSVDMLELPAYRPIHHTP
jgi:predicted nucleotidyltransferase